MSIPSTHYADLVDHQYKPPKRDPRNPTEFEPVKIDGVSYKPVKYVGGKDTNTGYQGTVYRREDTGEIIVVHRGTEFDREPWKDGVVADGQMVARQVNPQMADALKLTQEAREFAQDWAKKHPNKPRPEVTITGHSLGGALAEATAYYYGLRGETFNAYGAVGLPVGNKVVPANGGSQITNHVMATDPVSAGNTHFGQVKVYATRDEIAFLTGPGGYKLDSLGPGNALTTAVGHGFGMHGIRHFSRLALDDHQPHPYSVLQDPQAQVRAAQHLPVINQYRHEVGTVREQVALGAQVGGALGTGVGYAATAQTRVQAWTLDVTGDAARATTHVQAKVVEHGGQMAGMTVGGAVHGIGELTAQGRELRGEAAAAIDQLQGVAQQRGTQGVADLLRGVASLLPEEQRRQLEQMADQVKQSGEQANTRQQAEADAARRTARDDAQQWRTRGQALGDGVETRVREGGRQASEGMAASGRWVDEQLDRGSQQLKHGADRMTQAGRAVGEGVGAVDALLRGAVIRQAVDRPTEVFEHLRDTIKSPGSTKGDAQHAPKVEREPLSYLDPTHRDHALFQRIREAMPAQMSDEKVAELTQAAKRGGVLSADRILEMGISNDRGYVYGPLGTAGAVVDLRTPAPPMAETMRQAETAEQQQVAQLAQVQEQQRRSHEPGGRAMA